MYQSLIYHSNRLEPHKQKEIQNIYSFHEESHIFKLPFSVRAKFSDIIERHVCGDDLLTFKHGRNPRDPADFPLIVQFLEEIIRAVEEALQFPGWSIDIQSEMRKTMQNFKEFVVKDPNGLFNHIRNLLLSEMEVIHDIEIRKQLDVLDKQVREADSILNQIEKLEKSSDPGGLIRILRDKIHQNYAAFASLVNEHIPAKICKWKQEQQRMATKLFFAKDKPLLFHTISLTNISFWANKIASLIHASYKQARSIEKLMKKPNLKKNSEETHQYFQSESKDFSTLLHSLLKICFIVEEQPQVFRTGKIFEGEIKASLLIWDVLNGEYPDVRIYFIDKKQAQTHQNISEEKTSVFGRFSKPVGLGRVSIRHQFKSLAETLVQENKKNILRTTFGKKLFLTSVIRKENGAKEDETKVSKEQYYFYLVCDAKVGSQTFKISTVSLPVLVTTHETQNSSALTTIAWLNAFSDIERNSFKEPDVACWWEVAHILNSRFIDATGRGLTELNLASLKQKALKNQSGNLPVGMVSLKAPPKEGDVEFWTWFHAALKVATNEKYKLQEIWSNGYLLGFVDKENAQNILANCKVGTFLLRFSDSVEGAISPVVLKEPGSVVHVEPLTTKDLEYKHLSVHLSRMKELEYIYKSDGAVDTKDTGFGRYYENITDTVGTNLRRYVGVNAEVRIAGEAENLPAPTASSPGIITSLASDQSGSCYAGSDSISEGEASPTGSSSQLPFTSICLNSSSTSLWDTVFGNDAIPPNQFTGVSFEQSLQNLELDDVSNTTGPTSLWIQSQPPGISSKPLAFQDLSIPTYGCYGEMMMEQTCMDTPEILSTSHTFDLDACLTANDARHLDLSVACQDDLEEMDTVDPTLSNISTIV